MFDETPTPKQSATWSLWKTAGEELLGEMTEYAFSRLQHGDSPRAAAAATLVQETAHFVEMMEVSSEWTDDLRVLRQQTYFELKRRFELLMAGVSTPPMMCEDCPRRKT